MFLQVVVSGTLTGSKGTGFARYSEAEIAGDKPNYVKISDECRWHHERPPRPAGEGGV